MSERSRTWGGAPNRWTPPAPARGWAAEPDRAEATDGRHAFDRDAALTPIFTALRRGGRRRLRAAAPPLRPAPEPLPPPLRSAPEPLPPPLRVVPEPVERHGGDPPTAPIPVVPALHALDRYPTGGYAASSVDPYATAGYRHPAHPPAAAVPGPSRAAPPPSDNETTAVWHLPDLVAYRPDDQSAYRRDDPMAYSPVTDTGRHHRRLAPAGW